MVMVENEMHQHSSTAAYMAEYQPANEINEYEPDPYTVAVVHYFSEREDGVSLEINENIQGIEELDERYSLVKVSADAVGHNKHGVHHVQIPELDYSSYKVQEIVRGKVFGATPLEAEERAKEEFDRQVDQLEKRFRDMIEEVRPGVLHIRNICCLPIHPAASVAMDRIIRDPRYKKITFILQNHDIYDEPEGEDDKDGHKRRKQYEIPYPSIQKEVMDAMLPHGPELPNVKQVCINSLGKRHLEKKGIHVDEIVPDAQVLDKDPEEPSSEEIAALKRKLGIPEDTIVVGMMARRLPRKAVEVSYQLFSLIKNLFEESRDYFIENNIKIGGVTVTENTKLVLMLPQNAGLDEAKNAEYVEKLIPYAHKLGIDEDIYEVGENIISDSALAALSEEEAAYIRQHKVSFYEAYKIVNLFILGSIQEGFGNQVLEGIALLNQLLALHEWPVLEADIKEVFIKNGYISLGNNRQYHHLKDENFQELYELDRRKLTEAARRIVYYWYHSDKAINKAKANRKHFNEHFGRKVVAQKLLNLFPASEAA